MAVSLKKSKKVDLSKSEISHDEKLKPKSKHRDYSFLIIWIILILTIFLFFFVILFSTDDTSSVFGSFHYAISFVLHSTIGKFFLSCSFILSFIMILLKVFKTWR